MLAELQTITALQTFFTLASILSFALIGSYFAIFNQKKLLLTGGILVTIISLCIEGILIHKLIDLPLGQNLHWSNIVAMVFWLMTILSLIGTSKQNSYYLLVLLLPLNLFAGLLPLTTEQVLMFETKHNLNALIHILSAITAISFMGHASLQALSIYLQDYLLKQHAKVAIPNLFPPMIKMEQMLFSIIMLGFLVLSLALFSGIYYAEGNFSSIILIKKSLFAILAWALFLFLLVGRKIFGWRGRFAAKWVLSAFIALILSYGFSKWL